MVRVWDADLRAGRPVISRPNMNVTTLVKSVW
jgi:hypothetical protein